jgi:hypothetical protein
MGAHARRVARQRVCRLVRSPAKSVDRDGAYLVVHAEDTVPVPKRSCDMRRIVLAVLLALLAVPATSFAQAPGQDSVTGSGTFESGLRFAFDARSGPSGETPTGTVDFDFFAGTVTCLEVQGNVAAVVVATPTFGFPVGLIVVDNTASGAPDTVQSGPAVPSSGFGRCSGGNVLFDVVATGDISVVDAAPLPTSKSQCKNGGWRQYGVFKNQGDCVSSVATGGRNQPANPPT